MNGLRVALITPRYWPLTGGEATQIAHLAGGLLRLGAEPTVVSPGYEPTWPRQFQHGGVPIVRPPLRPGRLWRKTNIKAALGQWFQSVSERIDCICVSGCGDEAAATLTWAAEREVPVVLRVGDADVDPRVQRRRERICHTASAFIAPTASIAANSIAAGYSRERIRTIAPGVADSCLPQAQEVTAAKAAARAALAELDPLRGMPDHATLTLCLASRGASPGLENLVEAWPAIVGRWPNARLWIAGEGPWRDALVRQVDTLRLAGRVVLPGAFENTRELLAAADLYIHPAPGERLSIGLLEAMAAGLPVIASETAGREIIEPGQHGLLVPAADSNALAAAITRLFDFPHQAKRLGQAAGALAARRYSIETMAADHLRLFRELVSELAGLRHPPHDAGPPQAKQRVSGRSDRQRAR